MLWNYSPAEASLAAVSSSHSAQSSWGQHQHIDVVLVHHCARKNLLSIWSRSKSLNDIWPAECQKHFYHFALACTHESHHVVPNCGSCHCGPQVIAETQPDLLGYRRRPRDFKSCLAKAGNVAARAGAGTFPVVNWTGDVRQVPVLHRPIEAHVDVLVEQPVDVGKTVSAEGGSSLGHLGHPLSRRENCKKERAAFRDVKILSGLCAGWKRGGCLEQVVIFTPYVALEGDFAVGVKVGIVDTRTGNTGDVPSLRLAWGTEMRMREGGVGGGSTWEVALLLYCHKVNMCGRVEAVDVVHKKVVPIFYIDPQETLFGKGKLGKIEIVEVPAKARSECGS